MKKRILPFLFLPLLFSGCLTHIIHQGNVFKENNVWLVSEGNTRFEVEQLLGTPALQDPLHPNRVHYVEEFDDPDTGESYTRGIDIDYNDSLRVERIHRFGFEKP